MIKMYVLIIVGDRQYETTSIDPVNRDQVPNVLAKILTQTLTQFKHDKEGYENHYTDPEIKN